MILHLIPVVDEGLGNSTYLMDLGAGLALVVDPELDVRQVRADPPARADHSVRRGGTYVMPHGLAKRSSVQTPCFPIRRIPGGGFCRRQRQRTVRFPGPGSPTMTRLPSISACGRLGVPVHVLVAAVAPRGRGGVRTRDSPGRGGHRACVVRSVAPEFRRLRR